MTNVAIGYDLTTGTLSVLVDGQPVVGVDSVFLKSGGSLSLTDDKGRDLLPEQTQARSAIASAFGFEAEAGTAS